MIKRLQVLGGIILSVEYIASKFRGAMASHDIATDGKGKFYRDFGFLYPRNAEHRTWNLV